MTIATTQLRPTKVSLNTKYLTYDDSVKTWRTYLAEVYCRQDVKLFKTDPVQGSIERCSANNLIVSSFRSGGAQRVVRTNEMAKADMVEHYHFVFPRQGKFAFQQQRVESIGRRGNAFIINASQPFRIDFSENARSLVVAVPCELLRQRIVGIDDYVQNDSLSDPFCIGMLTNFCAKILNVESVIDVSKMQDLCIDLLEMAFSSAKDRRDVSGRLDETVRTVIRKGLSDPNFRLAQVAALCGVSTRQVQKVLSLHGTTFGQELLYARLAKASNLLKKRGAATMTIGQIAQISGFSNKSHFSSCYRKRFGIAPRDEK